MKEKSPKNILFIVLNVLTKILKPNLGKCSYELEEIAKKTQKSKS